MKIYQVTAECWDVDNPNDPDEIEGSEGSETFTVCVTEHLEVAEGCMKQHNDIREYGKGGRIFVYLITWENGVTKDTKQVLSILDEY